MVQILFVPARAPWADHAERAVKTPAGEPFFADAPEVTKHAAEKLASPLYAVAVRIATRGESQPRAIEILEGLAAGLMQFGSGTRNAFAFHTPPSLRGLQADILERGTHRTGMLLSRDELSSLLPIPGPGVVVPVLVRTEAGEKRAPSEVLGDGIAIGSNVVHGEAVDVSLPLIARLKHVHVLGASGTGKSTLLVRMILGDIEAGHGVAVLDPHGDLVEVVAARLPQRRLPDTIYFKPGSSPLGWNILEARSAVEKDLLASDLVGVFQRLSTSWGDQMTAVLANAILVFLEHPRGGTLLDLRRFLVEKSFRDEVLSGIADPYVRSFWETEFPLLVGRKPQAPILTRLDTFLRSRLVREIVTEHPGTLDFSAITNKSGVFLGNLAQGAIGQENAALLGSLLVSKLHQVTVARQGVAEAERRPFFLYIDEFHHVATPSMADLFSGVRKYRLGMTVAHQDLYQLHRQVPEVERSLLANAYTRIVFRVGEEDARQLERGFSSFEARDLTKLGTGEAICRVGGSSDDFNLTTERLPALAAETARERLGQVVQGSRERWKKERGEAPQAAWSAPERPTEPREADRTPQTPAAPPTSPGESRERTQAPEPETPSLSKEALDYLEHVATEPLLSVRDRNAALGLSAWKGQQLKAALTDSGYLKEVAVNPGTRGGRFLLLEVTEAGRAELSRFGVAPAAGLGRGGVAHQWWVEEIAGWLSSESIPVTVEDDSRGVRVDLSIRVAGAPIAVEVEMGWRHALENIEKDRAAGYRVVVLFADDADLERAQGKLSEEEEEVSLGTLRDFRHHLARHLPTRFTRIRGQNQTKEPSRTRSRRKARRDVPDTPAALPEDGAYPTPLAAAYVGLSPATLETMRVRGGGPAFLKLGRRVVYRKADLDSWLAERRRKSTSDEGSGA